MICWDWQIIFLHDGCVLIDFTVDAQNSCLQSRLLDVGVWAWPAFWRNREAIKAWGEDSLFVILDRLQKIVLNKIFRYPTLSNKLGEDVRDKFTDWSLVGGWWDAIIEIEVHCVVTTCSVVSKPQITIEHTVMVGVDTLESALDTLVDILPNLNEGVQVLPDVQLYILYGGGDLIDVEG